MNKKSLLLVGVVTFVVLLVMSIIFFKERTVFIDIAYHLFFILKDGDFAIQNYRFGAFFTQLFPLVSSKLGLPLEDVAMLYSASFVLLYFSTFLIILKGVKSEKIALCYLLFCTLMVRHTFYWVQSELTQATAFAFIYFALLYEGLVRGNFKFGIHILMFLLLIVVGFTHPLMPFLMLFVLVFFALKFPKKKKFIGAQFLIFVVVWFTKSTFFKTSYDTEATGALWNGLRLFPHYFNIQANRIFLRYLIYDYNLILLLLMVAVSFYIYHKKFLLCFLTVTFFVAYTLTINLSEPHGANQFYIENRYLLLSVAAIFPFVFDVLPILTQKKKGTIVVSILLVIGVFSIFNTHRIYTVRLNWNRNFLDRVNDLEHKKLIVAPAQMPKEILMMNWGASYESWLLSSIEEGKTISWIVGEQEHQFDEAMSRKSAIQTMWGIFDYHEFPVQYFHFTDTTTTYVKYP